MSSTRVEFTITHACTGRCKHCSLGELSSAGEHINYARMTGLLVRLKAEHPIESVMCFGGEPLLYPEEVCAILREAKAAGIPRRQLITNGFFSRDPEKIIAVAGRLNECATEILLSVDAFHQETIPLEPVQIFARHAENLRLHPAWLVSPEDENPWNLRTREIIAQFGDIPVSGGNVVFPRGNALKYLREYFPEELPRVSPYDGMPSLCVSPDGDIRGLGNAYRDNILEMAAKA